MDVLAVGDRVHPGVLGRVPGGAEDPLGRVLEAVEIGPLLAGMVLAGDHPGRLVDATQVLLVLRRAGDGVLRGLPVGVDLGGPARVDGVHARVEVGLGLGQVRLRARPAQVLGVMVEPAPLGGEGVDGRTLVLGGVLRTHGRRGGDHPVGVLPVGLGSGRQLLMVVEVPATAVVDSLGLAAADAVLEVLDPAAGGALQGHRLVPHVGGGLLQLPGLDVALVPDVGIVGRVVGRRPSGVDGGAETALDVALRPHDVAGRSLPLPVEVRPLQRPVLGNVASAFRLGHGKCPCCDLRIRLG